LTKFNGVFFGDFKSSKNGGSQGPLAIGGSFTGENAFLNQRNQLTCAAETDSVFGHHGLILKGAINSSIKVNGFAHVANLSTSNTITVPLRECSVKTAVTDYDFEATRSNVLGMSRHMAGMFPNWTIDKQGVLVKVIAESAQHLVQPYNVFSLPAFCNSATCERKSYFDCTEDQACEIPSHALSDIDIMILGKGVWTGPLEQAFPKDEMIIFNVSFYFFFFLY
jgi:choice-of-anchor A domain-containing protein